jgi:hypothetical protein
MDAEIGMLPPRLSGGAVGVLSRAFHHDPILTYYLGQGPRRAVANRMFFADIVQSALPFRHVYAIAAGDRVEGVAVWKPPNAAASSRTTATVLRELVVRALYPRAARGLFAGFAGLEALHPTAPHWYLMFVGVDIGLQSQGMGSRLLMPVLELADADRISVIWRRHFAERTSSISDLDSRSRRSRTRFRAHHRCGG